MPKFKIGDCVKLVAGNGELVYKILEYDNIWYDCSLISSKYFMDKVGTKTIIKIEYLESNAVIYNYLMPVVLNSIHKCNCDLRNLLVNGCKCGGN